VALRTRREPAQFVRARIDFVGLEDFIDYAHSFDSLANEVAAFESSAH
jgi:hypothetical protein